MKFKYSFICVFMVLCSFLMTSFSFARVGRMGGWASTDDKFKTREGENETFDKLMPWAKTEITKPAYKTPAEDDENKTGDMDIDYTGSKVYELPPVLKSVKDLEIK